MTTLEKSIFENAVSQWSKKEGMLGQYQQKALRLFLDMNFFEKKFESYQYFKVKSIAKAAVEPASIREIDENKVKEALKDLLKIGHRLVIYNGHFLPRYSDLPESIIIKPLADAFIGYGVFFKNLFDSWLAREKDPFSLLSLVCHHEGLFAYIPSGHVEKEPLEIVEINETNHRQLASPFVVFSAGKNSQVNIVTRSLDIGSQEGFSNASYLFHLDEKACINHFNHSSNHKSLSLRCNRAFLKKNSLYKAVDTTLSSFKQRVSYWVQLQKNQAEAEIFSIAALTQSQQAHTYILIEHLAENCYSRQLVKNLLADEAQASFEGKIWVDSQAQQTNAYQLNQNCLLSKQAKCFSKPNLEIFADDVKASHGSTTGQMDVEQLFYLRSRGLSKAQSLKLMLAGFCQEVIERISIPLLKTKIERDFLSFYEDL